MAMVVITLRIMPESPEVDLSLINSSADALLKKHGSEIGRSEQKPIAFGLKSLDLTFVWDEKKGGTDNLEAEMAKIEGVNSVECTDARRAIG